MENLLSLTLEAHNAEQNHHRRYAVTIGRDLLDDWTVSIRYGCTGQRGRELLYTDADPAALMAVIRDRLQRRLSPPRRIGCSYRLAEFSAAPSFDASSWLPGNVMAGFLEVG
jgi:predicted DNA-binding WGR domain protein